MRKTIAALSLLLVAGGTWAQGPEDYYKRLAQQDMALFERYDANGDGRISRSDILGHIDLLARFNDIDINRDGYITREEMQTYVERQYLSRIASTK
ncbi:MAG: hypothetical protein DI596_03380 [Azospira oryzae]|uniref:EF-hand domain-containing protein n=1 Tax=Pelomicrobium methylotrophicum TaxID=2602750 RepID=A0A5C7EM41_9PROT|nr:EF-hand domain-containing protein [Pelomicrobium methylotrophicum]PZP62858.1 MAG: hypothetical protein DI596_03380 [Azospira oryzae]PZP81777.1 MAG: hypothetical protein DI593_03380 [Azospira oryzae]TXF12483.1 EF-hand domain-containing protein [Pelomicrobium methylotrophicum]